MTARNARAKTILNGIEAMTASKEEIIIWRIKCLTEEREELSESELNLIASFEEQFKRRGMLSERQMEVLEDIYDRHA